MMRQAESLLSFISGTPNPQTSRNQQNSRNLEAFRLWAAQSRFGRTATTFRTMHLCLSSFVPEAARRPSFVL